MDKLRTPENDDLFKAILSLTSVDECYEFFEDVCTINELLAMSQRLKVAMMLKEDRVYTDMAKETGASTATISRVNRSLQYGSGGYDKVIARISEK